MVASITSSSDSNLLILLRKQVGHYDEKVQKVGIIGTIQAIGVLGKAGQDHMINDQSTLQNTMTQVSEFFIFTKKRIMSLYPLTTV